ncbi:MAG: DUF1826 domain-containing protein [Betaproteobacteria bacterium]|nr:DUF1826 domain-containing protein [Betaproteobacteria bacterium]
MIATPLLSTMFEAVRPPSPSADLLSLLEIFEPNVQVVELPRPSDPLIKGYLASCAEHLAPGFRLVSDVRMLPLLQHLPEGRGRDAFLEDVQHLVEIYAELLGCRQVGLRIDITDRPMCPNFHVDRTGIRLLCTYQGAGTEWVEDESGPKELERPASDGARPVLDRLHLARFGFGRRRVAQPFSVLLLKGSAWQGNEGLGAIHRSPHHAVGRRVLLALDALW